MAKADRWAGLAAFMVLALTAACEQSGPDQAVAPPPAPAAPAQAASSWQGNEGSQLLAVPPPGADPALAADLARAIGQARTTADDARRRWQARPGNDDAAWAVKWAAPTEAGGVEHVWVVPLRWSVFRIEGRLASPPREPLACGRILSELVSFPVEELSDWVVQTGARREGGYTIEVLEKHFGAP